MKYIRKKELHTRRDAIQTKWNEDQIFLESHGKLENWVKW